MKNKSVTIYDIAKALEIHPSYVSRALNGHESIHPKMIAKVKSKASDLNYRQNSSAANLRKGLSKTIGVVVPKINETFFSNAIAGIEQVAALNKHHVIICQSYENLEKEVEAVDTLIRQRVDCIVISLSAQTKTIAHLKQILKHDIKLVQFDRCNHSVQSLFVENDNYHAAFSAGLHLVSMQYQHIAYIGGPGHFNIYQDRKKGFIDAMRKSGRSITVSHLAETALSENEAKIAALRLLESRKPPDAFLASSDHAALGIFKACQQLKISIPTDVGIIGFQNEEFASLMVPALTSVDQKSFDLGRCAAELYFHQSSSAKATASVSKVKVVHCELVVRQSSMKIPN